MPSAAPSRAPSLAVRRSARARLAPGGATPGARLSVWLTWVLLVAALAACGGAPAPTTPARVWVDGPVRWLMTPEELRTFRGLADDRTVLDFIESFWRRRNPDPDADDNAARQAFYERAAAADRLYAEKNRSGSLTHRGRVMVLLGPPSVLKFRQQAVPAFDPHRHRGRPGTSTGTISVEVWEYLASDLPPRIAAELAEEGREALTLSFVTEGGRTSLIEGGGFLDRVPALIAGPSS